MDLRRLNYETFLYILAFIIALGLRFYNLGAVPLSDSEASWALQALQVANPGHGNLQLVLGPQPAYVFLTSILFSLFSGSNFFARFWPALAGSILILIPIIFRNKLGRLATLIIVSGLALDPGLVAVSRQAGGPMMALVFCLFALGFWKMHNPILVGIFAGLALLSGPATYTGILILILVWLAFKYLKKRDINVPDPGETSLSESDLISDATQTPSLDNKKFPSSTELRLLLISAGLTILILGTFFFRYPEGISAWFNALPTYLKGWLTPSGIPLTRLIAALVVYQPFAIILAIVGSASWLFKPPTQNKQLNMIFSVTSFWIIAALALVLLYPGRQVADLIWVLVPVWILAAKTLEKYLPSGALSPISLALSILIILLMGLFWNSLITINLTILATKPLEIGLRVAVLIGIFALGALSTVLVSMGWSWQISRNGLILGIITGFAIYSIAVMWSLSQLRANQATELWSPLPGPGQTSLLVQTLNDLSKSQTGFPTEIEVVSMVETASIQWALRDFNNTVFVSEPNLDDLPELIITRIEDEFPALNVSYRGQDFVWEVNPGWTGSLPPDIIRWLTFRESPLSKEWVILWVRSDLFPDSSVESQSPSPDQEEIDMQGEIE
jgi:hypothetical protein